MMMVLRHVRAFLHEYPREHQVVAHDHFATYQIVQLFVFDVFPGNVFAGGFRAH
jgi:hypothetical protein